MSPIEIAIAICVCLVVIVVCVALYSKSTTSSAVDTSLVQTPVLIGEIASIDGSKLAKLSQIGIEYTYNMWVKVTDPGVSSKPKCILYRSSLSPHNASPKPANPSIWLKPDNSLMVRASTRVNTTNPSSSDLQAALYPEYPAEEVAGATYSNVNPLKQENISNADQNKKTAVCDVNNIPMQRWVQITVVLWNQTMDVYINGKLTRSCILPGMPLHDADALKTIYIGGDKNDTDADYFNGYVARVRYFNHAITAADVMELYKKGPVPVTWWWQTMRNRVKVMLEIGEDE